MPSVFISYAREDRDIAQALAQALLAHGIDVWWDRELTGGGDFALEIERQLNAAALALALWSPASVQSEFVRDEASRARDRQVLLPVRIAEVELPLGFGTLHTLELLGWDGDPDNEACRELLQQVQARVEQVPVSTSGAGAAGLARQPLFDLDSADDTLTRRRQRRRLLSLGGVVGLVGLGAAGWLGWQRSETAQRQSQARERLDKALRDHFGQPPLLESAQSAYSDALVLDPALARAHYFLGHLYAQLMLRGVPPPSNPVLEALRADAREHFAASLELGRADPLRLDNSQRLIADQQLALLKQTDVAAPIARSVEGTGGTAAAAAVTAPDAPTPVASAPVAIAQAGPPRTPPASVTTLPRPDAATAASGPALPKLPRIQAPASVTQAARGRALALFSNDRDTRLAAGTSLTLDPALAAEALPMAISQASAALQHGREDAATRQGLTNTLALLGRASPSTLRENQSALQALLQGPVRDNDPALRDAAILVQGELLRSARTKPLAYIQIAHERQRPVAQALARRLTEAGYITPAIGNTGEARAPARPSLRSQGASDPDLARWCQKVLAEAAGAPADLDTLRKARPTTDTFELWFDTAMCQPGGRRVPNCLG